MIVKEGKIKFKNVYFRYSSSTALFNKLHVNIYPAEKVGLVGFSGSWKTTFVNLILRLFDIQRGTILIDGQDITACTQESLRKAIAMIPQEPTLFHRSILENIRYGRIDATDEEVKAAEKKAHAHDLIVTIPGGV